MPRAIRILRVALPIAFVAFIGVLVISYTSSSRKSTEEPAAPETATRPEIGHPQLITHQFEDTHSVGGRTLSKITARRTVGFSSGWHTLEDVELTVYKAGGGRYVVSAPSARFKSDTKEAEVRGGVRVRSDDGVDISTRQVDFDGHHLTNRIPIRFKVDRWSGEARGFNLNVDAQTLKLVEKVRASMSPVAGAPPMEFSADSATFDRATGEAEFDGHVEIDRGAERLAARTMIVRFDQSRNVLVGMEGTGNVTIHLGPGNGGVAASDETGSKDIQADHLSVETGPQGEVRAVTAEAKNGQARAVLHGPPERIIEADKFRVTLDQKVARSIEATGHATMTEKASPRNRTASAQLFRIYLDPKTGEMTSAYLEGGVTFQSENIKALSQRANYSTGDDHLVLTAEAGSAPTIESDTAKMRAEVIEANPATGILRARGRVVAQLEQRDGSSDSVIFNASRGQVFVNADSALVNQADKTAVFSGHVKAWQGNNNLFADELQIADGGATIHARGGVRTTLYNTTEAERAGPPVTTSSQRLSADRKDGTIVLKGQVTVSDGGRSVQSDESVFHFDAQRRLERVVSTGSIKLEEPSTGRKGTGKKVVYEVAQRRILIDGDPATMSDPQGSIKGSRIVFDVAKNRVDVVRGSDPTEATMQPHG